MVQCRYASPPLHSCLPPFPPCSQAQEASAFAPLVAAADVAKGTTFAKRCAACHAFEKDAGNKVGPNLWGVVDRPIASVADFSYSEAMETFSEGGAKLWTYDELSAYLENPKGHIPGNKMAFPGVKKEEDRANVIAYLRTLADTPAPLPRSQSEPGLSATSPKGRPTSRPSPFQLTDLSGVAAAMCLYMTAWIRCRDLAPMLMRLLSAAPLSLRQPLCRTGPGRRMEARHGAHRRPEIPAGFAHFDYVNPDAPKGGLVRLAIAGRLRQLQSDPRHARQSGGRPRLSLRSADGVVLRRARHQRRIRADRRGDEVPGGFLERHLPPQSEGPLARRPADHRGRRRLEFREDRRAQSERPLLLQPRHQGRDHRRTRGDLHLRRARQPRAAAHHGPARGPAEALVGGEGRAAAAARHLQDDARAAARLRALPHQVVRAGTETSSTSGSRTIGARTSTSTSATTISTRSASTNIATRRCCWRPSRATSTTIGSRTPPRTGRPATISRRGSRAR